MISSEQIGRIAREQKLAVGVVEKDYALTWLLRGIYLSSSKIRDSFVLKGGTAIRKVYFPQTWRFSEDLDFTVLGNKGAEDIKSSMQQVFDMLLQESGVRFSFDSFHATPGTIIANVQFLGPLSFTNRIKHDINLKEKLVLEPEWRPIRVGYPVCRSSTFSPILWPRFWWRRFEALCRGAIRAIITMCGVCSKRTSSTIRR